MEKMKKRTILMAMALSLICLIAFSLAGCSGKQEIKTTADPSTQAQEEYKPQTQPLENVNVDDLKSKEITPSGDPNCFLSPCDCNCYQVKNVPLTARKVTCGMNCRTEYGVTGCLYRGDKCVALK